MFYLVKWLQPAVGIRGVSFLIMRKDAICYADGVNSLKEVCHWEKFPEYYKRALLYWRVTEMREL